LARCFITVKTSPSQSLITSHRTANQKRGILSNPALCKARSTERSQIELAAVFAPAATVATAIAAITTAAATATAVAAATAARTFFARARFIHRQGSAIETFAIERLNCGICILFIFHGDKGETAGAAAEFVHNQIHFQNVAMGGEHILKLVFGGVEGKISNKQFCTHDDLLFLTDSPFELFPTVGFQIITEALFN
jgi:hypothetical protein